MNDNDRKLYYLEELSGYKVADDDCDVRGWEVIDAEGQTVGTVDDLLVSKADERVVYLDVEVSENLFKNEHQADVVPVSQGAYAFLNKDGDNHLILPVGMVSLDEDAKKVIARKISHASFSKAARFPKNGSLNREHEITVLRQFLPDAAVDYPSSIDEYFYNGPAFENGLRRRKREK